MNLDKFNFSVRAKPADDLAPLGTKTSVGITMTEFCQAYV